MIKETSSNQPCGRDSECKMECFLSHTEYEPGMVFFWHKRNIRYIWSSSIHLIAVGTC